MTVNQKEQIYLSLGSNLGDREGNLSAVFSALPPEVIVTGSSSIYQTVPWGFRDQPDFLNQILQAETALSPQALLRYVKGIEKQIGREPSFLYGPRLVDIDILLYGNQIISEDNLTIPHKNIPERAFILVPLAELSPELIFPESSIPIQEILNSIDTSGISLYISSQD